MILHGYWRSSAAYRVRIGLALKGLEYLNSSYDLRKDGQKSPAFLSLNPQGLVPALEVEGQVITQSAAILEWLDEAHPDPALLPADVMDRARVRGMAALIASDIHPLNNLRVLKRLRGDFALDQAGVDAWAGRWIAAGFDALEVLVGRDGAGWCFGDVPTLADCYLIPQLYSARRFNLDLTPWPGLLAVESRAEAHPAFVSAHPDRQPDAD